MARYRLLAKHYLVVPGNEWEQVEINQANQKQVRKRYAVPLYLDPDDPGTHPHTMPGRVPDFIVSTKEDPAFPLDIIFVGPPSLDMEPLDAEAIKLVAAVRARTVAPMSVEAFPASGPAMVEAAKPSDPVAAQMAEMSKMMAEMRGQMTLMIGENEGLRQQLAALQAEAEDSEGSPPPAPASVEAPRPALL